jgi:type II secretory pathway component PulF
MPQFSYQATDATGARREGTVEAVDILAAKVNLSAQGLRVVAIAPERQSYAGAAEALSAADANQLALHLVELTKAGVPLASGLESLAAELPSGRLARTLDRIGK